MTLLYPIFIYLLLPLVLILFYFLMTGSKQSFLAFDKEVLDRLRHEKRSLSRGARNTLFLISFVLMIISMSQPVIKEGEIVVEAKSADILVGIDISDSMKAQDRYPNRLDFAKHKAIELIKTAPHNRIGVLAFAKHDYIVSPLSFDHSSVAFLLSKVSTKNITEKGTHLDSMLRSAIAMLEHADTKNLLLFTDGGDKYDFSQEIELAKDNGLRLFILGVGTSKGSPVRSEEGGFVKDNGNILISRLNENIQDLATKTGGVYIESVLGNEDINTMLNEIESITEKSTLKEETIPQYTQLFYYPLALALLFLLLAFSSLPKSLAKSFVVLGLVFFGLEDAKAGLMDFKKLEDARQAYESQDYKKSAQMYEEFAIDSPQAVYNLGNSLYKDGDYERALKVYNKVSSEDKTFKSKALYNAGNTQVKLQQYEEALKSYEEALNLEKDQQTRENYEALKKFLEEKKKEDQQKNQEDQNKESQDKENQENQKNSDQSKDKENSDQSKESQDKEDQQKSQNQENEQKENSEKKSDKKNKNVEEEAQKDKKEKKEASQKSQEEKEKEMQESRLSQAKAVNTKEMSELEAKKWINIIKKSQKGHLYKMQAKEHEEDNNEKPW